MTGDVGWVVGLGGCVVVMCGFFAEVLMEGCLDFYMGWACGSTTTDFGFTTVGL